MQTKKHLIPVIGLTALLVLVGQGCPGQQAPAPETAPEPDTMMEDTQQPSPEADKTTEAETEVNIGTQDAPYGIPIPDVAFDRRGPNQTGSGVWRFSFMLPDWSEEETRQYFIDTLTEHGWNVVHDEESELGIEVRGETARERVSIGISHIPVVEDVEVDMILKSPK